jgi:hypothetical protein
MSAHQNSCCQSPYCPVSSGVQFSTNRPRCANQASANSTLTIVIYNVQILEFSLVFRYAVTTSLGRMVCGSLHTRVFLSSSVHSVKDVRTALAILVSIWGPNHGCLSPMQVTWSPPTRVDLHIGKWPHWQVTGGVQNNRPAMVGGKAECAHPRVLWHWIWRCFCSFILCRSLQSEGRAWSVLISDCLEASHCLDDHPTVEMLRNPYRDSR